MPSRRSSARTSPPSYSSSTLFFFNDTATTEIYTLSLHDALPIHRVAVRAQRPPPRQPTVEGGKVDEQATHRLDRKSTRLNSSHANISYAVFCLKKKKKTINTVASEDNKKKPHKNP